MRVCPVCVQRFPDANKREFVRHVVIAHPDFALKNPVFVDEYRRYDDVPDNCTGCGAPLTGLICSYCKKTYEVATITTRLREKFGESEQVQRLCKLVEYIYANNAPPHRVSRRA